MSENQKALASLLEKFTALDSEVRALQPQLAQYTKGVVVTKGVKAAGQLLAQIKEQA